MFSWNKCRKEGVVSKRLSMQPRFLRNPSEMSLDELYQYYTGCSNGLQIDCFDERFVDSKPAWESYLERGLVSPRKMTVLDSAPDARKYNKEKCALNLLEEEKLVEGWKKAQEMEHTACLDLNEAYDALVDAKKSQSLTISHWKLLSDQFGDAQDEFAKFKMVVGDRKSNIDDVELVRGIEHNIRHAKFDAADIFKRWLSENCARKCFRCDTVISDMSTLTPSYSDMRVVLGVFLVGRVNVIPCGVTLSRLVSERVITLRRKVDVLVVKELIWELTFSWVGFL